MHRNLVFALALFTTSASIQATELLVTSNSGAVFEVDEQGQQSLFANGVGRPGALRGDRFGNTYTIDFDTDTVFRIDRNGVVHTFTTQIPTASVVDMAISPGGKPFVLTINSGTSDVWQLVAGGAPIFLATIFNEAPAGQTARGFTFGPGGHLYLATQGGTGSVRIIQVRLDGQVSTWYNPGFPTFSDPGGVNFTDIRFLCRDPLDTAFYILGRRRQNPSNPNTDRVIFKVEYGAITEITSPGDIMNGALQITVDEKDVLYVSGGGFGGGQPDGFIQRVELDGSVTTITSFPALGPIYDIELTSGSRSTIEWDPGSLSFCPNTGAVGYDVLRGDLGTLFGTGNYAASTAVCLADDLLASSLDYTTDPGIGEAHWFLMRTISEIGPESYDSGNPGQSGSRDAAIASSANACP